MAFTSYHFLFLFLPLVLVVNKFLSVKASNLFLLFASLLFYTLGEGQLVLLLIISIFWNYLVGLLLSDIQHPSFRKYLIALGVTGNILILIYNKYPGILPLNFLMSENGMMSIIRPLGISFFTFQGVSYLVDVYRGLHPAEKNPLTLGLYISLFPQLIAGPIVKYNEIVSYFSKRTTDLDQTVEGCFKFIRGLAKKVIIADGLALIADTAFTTDISALPTAIAWLGVLAYSLQIYYDFSGYSDMAIGLCLILGFKIPENFSHPYCSKSIREFWRRWHISLSSWFRDYLYLPLGGNRKGTGRTYLNLIIVFFLTGLWHGPFETFVIWGMLHGCFMIIERLFPFVFERLPKFVLHIYTLLVVGTTWVFFRKGTFHEAIGYIKSLFVYQTEGSWQALLYLTPYHLFLLGIGILFATPLRAQLYAKLSANNQRKVLKLSMACTIYLLIAIFCFTELSMSTYKPFIYFRF